MNLKMSTKMRWMPSRIRKVQNSRDQLNSGAQQCSLFSHMWAHLSEGYRILSNNGKIKVKKKKSKTLYYMDPMLMIELLLWLGDKESSCQYRRHGFDPWVGKIPWRREWLPTPGFLLGKPHGQRSLAGYSPWISESDITEWLNNTTALITN